MKQRTPGSRDSAHCPRPHRSSVTSCPVSEPPSYQHYTAPVAQACDGIIALVLGCCTSSQVGFRGSAGGGGVVRQGLTRLSCFSAKLVFRATKRLFPGKPLPTAKPYHKLEVPFLRGCTGLARPAPAHHAGLRGGVFTETSILREKSKVLQPCTVYILKFCMFLLL